MIEYRDWAKAQLSTDHVPSRDDWEGMSVGEMADRALAICAVARDGDVRHGRTFAFQCLEAMVKAMKDKYPRRD